MASATLGTVSYSDGSTFTFTGTAGAYCIGTKIGARRVEIEEITSPGLDGYGTKNYGGREREIVVEVHYINSSEDAINAAFIADMNTLVSTNTFAATIGTTSVGTCRLVSERCMLNQPRYVGVTSKYHAMGMVTIKQLRS